MDDIDSKALAEAIANDRAFNVLLHYQREHLVTRIADAITFTQAFLNSKLAALEDENKTLRDREQAAHRNFIEAWEALPGGTSYSKNLIQDWLVLTMKPAVDRARAALSKPATLPAAGPHRYQPSIKHMGDCSICGHVQDHPWHKPAALPAEGKGESEAVMAHLALIHSLANDITERNWADKRLYILQTCIRLSDLLSATPSAPQPLEGAVKVKELDALIEEAKDFTDRMTSQPWACELIDRLVSSLSPAPQPVGIDPLKGGCPHCNWLETNLGRVLDTKCDLHQKIEDMQVDLAMGQRVTKDLNAMLRDVVVALGGSDDDDPVALAKSRMEEIAELEELPAPQPVGEVLDGWVPLTCKDEQMTCRMPADETVVEVMLNDGTVCRSWFGSNIMEAGDWDFLPVHDDDEPDDEADSLGGRVVAWRAASPSPAAQEDGE